MVVFESDLGPIRLLNISFFTNVGITQPSGLNRSFRLVIYGLSTWVDNWIFKVQVYPKSIHFLL